MKTILLLLLCILCVSASAYAQSQVERIDLPGMTIDVGRPSRPDVDHSGAHGSGGNQQSPSRDPYPALTQANNAYNQAVAVYQRAYQNYQAALTKQARLRDHYVDSNNNVRPGFDYYAAVAVLHAADKEAEDAKWELDNATNAMNAAHSNAAREFVKASEQFARGQKEEAARKEAERQAASKRENSYGSRHDHN
jgi:hypothetical protein